MISPTKKGDWQVYTTIIKHKEKRMDIIKDEGAGMIRRERMP
jgi:hypothetical protein